MINRNWCGRAVGAVVETLEGRRMLAASAVVEDGTLVVTGTRRGDVINISLPPGSSVDVDVTINGVDQGLITGVQRILVLAGRGSDKVSVATPLPTRILGGRGNDTLIGGAADDEIHGGLGADSIIGTAGDDRLFGESGADSLDGGAGDDTLIGGRGNDRIWTTAGDVARGGKGVDDVRPAPTDEGLLPEPAYNIDANGILTIIGTEGDDDIAINYIGPDTYTSQLITDPYFILRVNGAYSRAIADELVKRFRIEGLGGNDMLSAGYEGGVVDADENELPVTMLGGAGDDTLTGGNGADQLEGGDGNDEIAGAEGDDVLVGNAGSDTIRGNAGGDVVHGGDGNDFVGGGTAIGIFGVADGEDSVYGDGGEDTFVLVNDTEAELKDKGADEKTTDEVVYGPRDGVTAPGGPGVVIMPVR